MRMSIAQKLALGTAAVLMLMVLSAAVAYYKIAEMNRNLAKVVDQAFPAVSACNDCLAILDQQSLNSGADDFVSKSQDMEVILAHIKSLMRRVRMMRHIQSINQKSYHQELALRESEWQREQAEERARYAETRYALYEELKKVAVELVGRQRRVYEKGSDPLEGTQKPAKKIRVRRGSPPLF